MKSSNIDTLLKGVKVVYWTDCYGNRDKHYKVHSRINPELWDIIERIWGEDWVQMRDVVIGNDYELNGCFATVPEKTWLSMVRQMKERLFIVRAVVKQWNGLLQTYIQEEWCESEDEVIEKVGLNHPDVVEYEILEAEHNQCNRYMGAEQIYRELKRA